MDVGGRHAQAASSTHVLLRKAHAHDRVGVSFAPEPIHDTGSAVEPPTVTALHPNGQAAAAGLRLGDRVISINGRPLTSALQAAEALRESVGTLHLGVERSTTDRPGEGPEALPFHPQIGRRPPPPGLPSDDPDAAAVMSCTLGLPELPLSWSSLESGAAGWWSRWLPLLTAPAPSSARHTLV
uniref:PDZ domain-containing protein n=1 Tax=Prymnesium polylepis TaxID=72548 RepID=A0A7S4M9X4_9EUKA